VGEGEGVGEVRAPPCPHAGRSADRSAARRTRRTRCILTGATYHLCAPQASPEGCRHREEVLRARRWPSVAGQPARKARERVDGGGWPAREPGNRWNRGCGFPQV